MGMFDSVWFRCPKCEEDMEAQSKAGECSLIDYRSSSVPESIAKDIAGEWVYCKKCKTSYQIEDRKEKMVKMRLTTDDPD